MEQVSGGKDLRGQDQPWNVLHIQYVKKKDAKDGKAPKTMSDMKDGPPKL